VTGAIVAAIVRGTSVDAAGLREAPADPHQQAQALAASTGTHVGALVSVAERNVCPPAGRLGNSFSLDPQTPAMHVNVQESVTYALSPP
jgi:hypothetical protein